jgi:Asp-tRNA(Asn)/Glu-tRNA(Gln) amidotransferase A subunit family amidase
LPSVFDNISHFGPLARTVDDAIAFLAAASGSSDEDIMSLPLVFNAAKARGMTLGGKRFALSMDLGYYVVDPVVEASMRAAVAQIRAAGAIVDEVSLPWTRAVNDQWSDIWGVFMSAYFGDALKTHRARMDPAVVGLIEQGLALDATSYKRIELLRSSMWHDLAAIFKTYDALLCPTCAVVAPSVDETDDDYMATLPDGRFKGLDMTCPFNLLPQCPALSLPISPSPQGLPVGLQIVGHRYADEDVLGIARAIEQLLGEAKRPGSFD